MNYNQLADSTAIMRAALKFIKTDDDDSIEVFLKELKAQIDENETLMDKYDKWIDQKTEEGGHDVD